MADNINDIVGKQAFEQVATLKAELTDVVETIETINATQINLTKGLSSQSGTANLQAVNNLLKDLQTNVTSLSGAYEKYNIVAQQVITKNADIAASFNLMRSALSGNTTAFNQLTAAQNAYAESSVKANIATKSTTETTGLLERIVGRMIVRIAAMAAIFGTTKLAIEEVGKEVDKINYKQKAALDIAQASTNKYSQEAAALVELKARFNDAGTTMADKQEIIKQLNTLLDGQYKSINNVSDAEKLFVEATPKIIEALELRAKAEAALNAITKEQQELLEKQADPSQVIGTWQKILIGLGSVGQTLNSGNHPGGISIPGFFKEIAQNYSAAANAAGKHELPDEIENTKKKVDFLSQSFIDAANASKKLADSVGFTVDPDKKGKAPHEFTESQLKDEQKYTLELAQEQSKRLQTEADYLKLASEDETQSLGDRILAYRNYVNVEKDAQKVLIDAQIEEQKEALATIEKLQGGKGKLSVADQNLINSKQVVLEKIQVLTAQYGLIEANETKKSQDGIKKIYNQDIQVRLKNLSDITDNVRIQADQQKEIEEKKYQDGLITYKQFKDKEKQIDDQSKITGLDLSKQYLKQQIDDSSLSDADKSNLQAKLNDVMKALYDADVKNFDDAAKKKEERAQLLQDKIFELLNEGLNAISTINDNNFAHWDELNQLKLQSTELTSQQEVLAVNASIGSQIQKQQQLNQINAQSAAQENQIAQEKKLQDIAEAKFKREAGIAAVILHTAEAIAKDTTKGWPEDLIPIAFDSAIGIAQLAAASSAPIPQYFVGKKKGEGGGVSLVGEKGAELIVHDGKMWITPPTPTLMNVPKDAEIFTAEKTMQIMKNTTSNSASFNAYANSHIDKYLDKQTSELGKKIEQLTMVTASKKAVIIKGFSKEQAEYERISLGR